MLMHLKAKLAFVWVVSSKR